MRQSANTKEVLSPDFFNDAENEAQELSCSTCLGVYIYAHKWVLSKRAAHTLKRLKNICYESEP